jgi:hypothetical protein
MELIIMINDEKYEKIEFTPGSKIYQVVNVLLGYKQFRKLAYGKFNGVTLYSDTVTMDDAYKKITGMTKMEFDTRYGADDNVK